LRYQGPGFAGAFLLWYLLYMTRLLEQAFNKVATLPDAEQDELARVLLELAGVDQPPIQLTPEEDADLAEAEAEIARGELASPEEVSAMWKKHGR
jgi:hypothetical protein